MACGLSNGHMTDNVTWSQRCCAAVRSAILATAWLLVTSYKLLLQYYKATATATASTPTTTANDYFW